MKRPGRTAWWLVLAVGWAGLGLSLLAAMDIGLQPIALVETLQSGWKGIAPADPIAGILVDIRLRRALMAVCAGAALALAGCSLQALLRNPLADPYVLGIAGGASLGAVAVMASRSLFARFGTGELDWLWGVLGSEAASNWMVPTGSGMVLVGATIGAFLSITLVYAIAGAGGRLEVRSMILAGVVLQVLLGAVVLIIWTLADRAVVNAHVQWLIGRIPDPPSVRVILFEAGLLSICWVGLRSLAPSFNALASGEADAATLGVDVEKLKRRTFILSSLLTAGVVSVCGLIGFVGLVVPHAARLLVGPDHRRLLTASALGGGIFLLWCDTLARASFQGIAMPVGAITALVGGPLFLWLLARERRSGLTEKL